MVGIANGLNITQNGVVTFNSTTGVFTGSAVTQHGVVVAGAANSLSTITPGTSGNVLKSNGTDWTSAAAANVGTVTQFDVLVGGAASAIASVGPGSSGQLLQSKGNASNPAYTTATYPSTATSTGTILRADGTNWAATTATYPATTTVSQLLYSSGTNVVGGLATAIDGVLVTSHTGVPSILANSGTAGWVLTANSGAPPSWQAGGGGSARLAFSARLQNDISTATGDGTVFVIPFDIAYVNDGSNYDTTTGIFTVPTGGAGVYHFEANVTLNNVIVGHTASQSFFTWNGFDQNFSFINPGVVQSGGFFTANGSWTILLSDADTVSVAQQVSGSTKTVGINGISSGTLFYSQFSGFKVG